jgi:hypothetical protein
LVLLIVLEHIAFQIPLCKAAFEANILLFEFLATDCSDEFPPVSLEAAELSRLKMLVESS